MWMPALKKSYSARASHPPSTFQPRGETVFDNPYCRCRKHLGMQFHTTAEHDYAQSEMEATEVSALQVSKEMVATVASWCGGLAVVEHDALDNEITFPAVNVPTNRGVKRASEDDWVIQQEDGSFDVLGPTDYQRSRTV